MAPLWKMLRDASSMEDAMLNKPLPYFTVRVPKEKFLLPLTASVF